MTGTQIQQRCHRRQLHGDGYVRATDVVQSDNRDADPKMSQTKTRDPCNHRATDPTDDSRDAKMRDAAFLEMKQSDDKIKPLSHSYKDPDSYHALSILNKCKDNLKGKNI